MKNKIFKSNIILYFFIIAVLFSNFYHIRINRKLRFQIDLIGNALKEEKDHSQESFLRNLKLNSFTSKISIPQYEIFKANTCGSYLLVYFYGDDDCAKCVYDDLDKIKNNILPNFQEKVHIFPVFDNSREIEIKLKAELDGFTYCRLNKNEVVLPTFQERSVRFFAILTPDGKLIDLFFPDILLPNRTNLYLDFIIKEYLN